MDFRKGKMIKGVGEAGRVEVSENNEEQPPQLTNNINYIDHTQLEGLQLLSDTALSDALQDDDNDHDLFSEECQKQIEQVDQMIKFHCDGLKSYMVGELRRRAEETAAKTLEHRRHQELEEMISRTKELENAVEYYKAEAEWLRDRVKFTKRMNMGMSVRLDESRRGMDGDESDTESSFLGTGRDRPVIIGCRSCRKRMADAIVLPCCHMCICTRCEPDTGACPKCGRQKTSFVAVQLPHKLSSFMSF